MNLSKKVKYPDSVYKTDPQFVKPSRFLSKLSWLFYLDVIIRVVIHRYRNRKGYKNQLNWASYRIIWMAERRMADVEVTGIENLRKNKGPFVIVGNHMSMMETFILFFLIRDPISFVLKDTLLKIPVFRHFLLQSDSIPVTRKHPGKDMSIVFTEGKKRLEEGRSVVLFPQGTRSTVFNPLHFNSLGVKLALRAGFPVIPLAVKTDFWGNGKLISYFGKIRPDKPVKLAFGEPVMPKGKGKEAHQQCLNFITEKMNEWGVPVEESK